MRYLITLITLLACVVCYAQEVGKMETNYVKLLVVGDHGIVSQGTGIAITKKKCLTVFHLLEVNTRIAAPNNEVAQPGRRNATIGKVIECDPYLDWCVVEFPDNLFHPSKIRFPPAVGIGEPVFSVTNMFGSGPVFLISHVAKLEDKRIFISPAMGQGASGSAMYISDEKGRPVFVGMFQGELRLEDSPIVLGYGLRAAHLKQVIRRHQRPPHPTVIPFPDASQSDTP